MNGLPNELDIDSLEFDKQNPRLPTSLKDASDSDIIRYLAAKTGIERLMISIGENGFFPGEAIVVTPHGPDKYTVIEGNRRLTALRLLQDPKLAGNIRSIARAAESAKHKPRRIPVYIVQSRVDTLQYLGFRHISGVQRWDPLAKARYLESLFNITEDEPGQRYRSVAREIGSTSTTVRRNLDALAAYKIIDRNDFYDIDNIEEQTFQFGTFYTATGNTDIANFIGIQYDGIHTNPITDSGVINKKHLRELTKYMFKQDDRGNTILGESRNISKLGAVLANERSLAAIRSGQSLEAAYRMTPHSRDEFIRHMNRAIEELKQANANLYAVDKDDTEAENIVSEALKIISLASDRLGMASND